MISKSEFESIASQFDLSNVANVNTATTGESLLCPISASEGEGVGQEDEEEVIEYLNNTAFLQVYDSNGYLGWLNAAGKHPCD